MIISKIGAPSTRQELRLWKDVYVMGLRSSVTATTVSCLTAGLWSTRNAYIKVCLASVSDPASKPSFTVTKRKSVVKVHINIAVCLVCLFVQCTSYDATSSFEIKS